MNEPYIDLPDAYGIRSLVMYRPETGRHLYDLVQVLLRGPSPLTEGQRELIAAYVSRLNNCVFCSGSHAAAARELLESNAAIVDKVLNNDKTVVDEKMNALLTIAAKVQASGKTVTEPDIQRARNAGATDNDIHDTVLIAAMFCMFNRYVDGLNTTAPADMSEYKEMGERMAGKGYVFPKTQS